VMAIILAIGNIHAQEPGPARTRLELFSEGLESLHAWFSQTITSQDGRVESEGAGQVWLSRPALFRWVYEGEFPELIVADGERVWLYDEVLEQVTVKPQSDLVDDSPLMLLT
ncbi:MAG: outer membrane lipoprotein chaperone LolA, partial [Xanthomonadales bacterium]|nr:outer membrane lipoprotein chaperone LolA [Xanthomonadales bacterium]NIX14230.1 outer membrane lipoprotein chaperone LolA [Xanthomonadales bacterium]